MSVSRKVFASVLCCAVVFATGCASGKGMDETGEADGTVKLERIPQDPANAQASDSARAVLAYIGSLGMNGTGGVLCGQNVFHGVQIVEGYPRLMDPIEKTTGDLPAILAVDYEHDAIYTAQELSECNAVLIDHWSKGGLIAINWSPHSPWLNDASDPATNPGIWSDTRSEGHDMSKVNLNHLIDPEFPEYAIWRTKLSRIADALAELRDAGVVVLWRPMQEMNGFWFWWGNETQGDKADAYQAVWQDMFRYFSDTRALDNLLWVYSASARNDTKSTRPVSWAYPGDGYVDIVTGTAYNDALLIKDYPEYISLGKLFGMAEYGADSSGSYATTGTFDNMRYINTIAKSYPDVGFWVCWHNWDWGNGTSTYHALASNRRTVELFSDPRVITLKKMQGAKTW